MTRLRRILAGFAAAIALAQPLWAWERPAAGSALETQLMDAVRPHAEWILGVPVVFEVLDLRVEGDMAFGNLVGLRPDGSEIARDSLPNREFMWHDPFDFGFAEVTVLYQKRGDTWVALFHAVGATDLWWGEPDLCDAFGPVIGDFCGQ